MFDIGFGFWILFFVIFFGCGRMCGWGAKRYRERHRRLEDTGGAQEDDRLTRLEQRVKGRSDEAGDRMLRPAMHWHEKGRKREPAPVRREQPSPLEALQQRFVEGRMTLDEYERELDRLERLE